MDEHTFNEEKSNKLRCADDHRCHKHYENDPCINASHALLPWSVCRNLALVVPGQPSLRLHSVLSCWACPSSRWGSAAAVCITAGSATNETLVEGISTEAVLPPSTLLVVASGNIDWWVKGPRSALSTTTVVEGVRVEGGLVDGIRGLVRDDGGLEGLWDRLRNRGWGGPTGCEICWGVGGGAELLSLSDGRDSYKYTHESECYLSRWCQQWLTARPSFEGACVGW